MPTPLPTIVNATAAEAPQSIGFLLVPQFSMMAFVSAVEPLRVANRLAQKELYRWQVLSRDGGSIAASNGMSLVADCAYAETKNQSLIVVCAGFEPERGFDNKMKRWLIGLGRSGIDLGAMDTGSFLLGWAGLLDGYKATTHWESLDSLREQFPETDVENSLFVIDRNRLTCAGGTAALDMMLHLISVRHGHRLAAAVSEQFIHAQIRDPHDHQRMEPRIRQGINHAGLARVIGLMEANLEEPLSSEKLSAAAGMSLRQLERLFHRYFGSTPRRYYLDLRLQRARALLQYTDMSMVEITVACGFGSAAHFSRSYHAWAGKPPSAERYRDVAGVMPSLR